MRERFHDFTDLLVALLTTYGMNVLGAVITLVFGFALAGWLASATDRALRHSHHIDPVFLRLPGQAVRGAVIVFTLIAVLNRFGVETTSLIAVLGAAGLAVGLALQGTLTNVASGVMILVFRPFKIGDAVKIDGTVYVIDELGFFVCKAHLPDGPLAVLPNSKIWGQTLVNFSVMDKDMRRIDETYGIGYGDDINTALKILRQIAADEPRILPDPKPFIAVEKLDASTVNVLFRVWTKAGDWWSTKIDLIQRCKEALEAGGISLPVPQHDVHVFSDPAGGTQSTPPQPAAAAGAAQASADSALMPRR